MWSTAQVNQCKLVEISLLSWAPYQIRKIAGCACPGNAGNVFPATVGSDPGDARAVMHVEIANTWLPLKLVARITFPAFQADAQPAIFILWICYERSFSKFYLSIWNQPVFNQRLQLFVQSLQPGLGPEYLVLVLVVLEYLISVLVLVLVLRPLGT